VPDDVESEVIVVDAGSTDATSCVLAEMPGARPQVAERDRNDGLSAARNRTVRVAAGEYIARTVDAVLVDPDWLRHFTEAFRPQPTQETALLHAVFAAGDTGRWVPAARVQQVTPRERLATRDVRTDHRVLGRRSVRFARRRDRAVPTLGDRAGNGVRGLGGYAVGRAMRRPTRWVHRLHTASVTRGTVAAVRAGAGTHGDP
jgi:glycosyltransferase involved in cell wall biosynthesis